MVAIDLLAMEPIAGVEFLQLDFMDATAPGRLEAMLREGGADIVLSDMAAQGTGHTRTDHLRIMGLAEAAVEFACEVLAPGGAFLCKVLQGGTERELLRRLKRGFRHRPARQAAGQPHRVGRALRDRHGLQRRCGATRAVGRGPQPRQRRNWRHAQLFPERIQEGLACAHRGASVA